MAKIKNSVNLRRQVEEVLQRRAAGQPDPPLEELYRLIGELQAYQQGLEEENEALRRAYTELETRLAGKTAKRLTADQKAQTEIVEHMALRREINERRQAEEALASERNLLRTLIDNLPDFIFVKDTGSRFVINNIAHVQALGATTQEEVVGKTDFDVFPREMAEQYYADERAVINTGRPLVDREEPYIDRAGNLRWLSTTKVALRDSHDKIVGLVGISRDVTAYKRADNLLRRAHDELEMRVLERTAELVKANKVLQAEILERKQAEQALRESEARFAGILDIAKEAIVSVDETQRIIIFNKGAENIFGYSAGEAIGQSLDLLIPERLQAIHRTHLVEFADSPIDARRMGERMEIFGCRKNGEIFPAEASISKLQLGAQRIYTAVLRDITDRKRAEAALRESEQRYKQLLGSVTDYIYTVYVEDGRVTKTIHSPNCVAVTGYTSQEYEANPHLWYQMVYEEDRPAVMEQANKLVSGEAVLPLEHRLIHKNGSIRWVRNTPVPRKDENKKIISYDGLISDITQRKQAEAEKERLFEEVKAGRERLQALSHRLVEVQEAERRHIARELHDEIGQLLTGLKLTLEMSSSLSGQGLKASLAEAQALINELIAQVRELSLELRPAMLDDLGLLPTLLWHFERYTPQTQIQVNFTHSGLNKRFRSEVETTAYRIVQEALTNVARHANVTEATVKLWVDQNALVVEIKDSGAGFDPQVQQAAANSSGLSGMHERAALLGGQLTIESSPQRGTRLVARLPLVAPVLAAGESEQTGS